MGVDYMAYWAIRSLKVAGDPAIIAAQDIKLRSKRLSPVIEGEKRERRELQEDIIDIQRGLNHLDRHYVVTICLP